MIPYENLKVFGPYVRKDGRKHVVLQDPNTKKLKTVSYPKYLVELREGRYLTTDETVDHEDGDFRNDAPENLQILSRKDNALKSTVRRAPHKFTCPVCQVEFELTGKKLHSATQNRKSGRSGPYCSRSCAGRDSGNTIRVFSEVKIEYE